MLILSIIFLSQTPILIESFTSPQFPPAGWDTLKSGANMTTWYRFSYGVAQPDSFHARQRVYDASDTLRTGWSILLTPVIDLTAYNGLESLYFWYRFSLANNNMGPNDTLYVEITNNQITWLSLMKIDAASDTNIWRIARLSLAHYDTFASARLRFRFEDRPNGSLGTSNCNFWLDSVKVISYYIDTIPPVITNTHPVNADTNIGINTNILVYFSEPINPQTIIPSAFNVTGSSSGSHSGILSYDSLNFVVQFNPESNFYYGETINVWVYDTIKDRFGNRLDGDNNGVPGGNYLFYFLTSLAPDTIPPSAVNNLVITNAGTNYAKLRWTAPGDDGNSGRASYYDIRFALFPITETNFYSANACTGEPPPSYAGQIDSFIVTGLSPGTLYYFALKTADEDSNWSLISNVPSCTTQTPLETLLVINEFLPDPKTFDHNNNGNYNDLDEEFIEVFNRAIYSINLSGYKIKDYVGMHILNIPNFTIPANGYLLLYASGEALLIAGDGDTLQTANWSGNWTDLDNTGDTVYLYDIFNRLVDKKGYQAASVIPDFSIARLPNGSNTWINNAFPSPGRNNGTTYVWPISVAFKDLDSNYIPDLLDSTVTICGVVTVPNGLFSNREAYIQDNTGGVCLYATNFPTPLNYGDSVLATGRVAQYRGKNELTNFTYQILKQGCAIPQPFEIDGNIANSEEYEGALVRIRVSYFGGFLLSATSYTAYDMANIPFEVYINAGTNIPGHLAPIDTFTLTGIKSQYTTSSVPNNGYEILPRDTSDFSHLFIMPEKKTIGLCQTPGSDGVSSKYVDSMVVVEGVITGPNYVFSSGKPGFYIQDNTGGINVYNPSGDSLFDRYIDSLGARFRVLGKVTEYNGLTEIANGYAWFLGMDTVPAPKFLEPNRFLTESMEGSLIKLKGVIKSTPYQTGDGYNFEILNGDCGITVRFTSGSGINPLTITKGETKIFTGIVGQYDPEMPYTTGYQLLLRTPDDIKAPDYDSASTEPMVEIVGPKTFLPEKGEQLKIKINSPADYTLNLKVYDMEGRMVRELYDGAGGPQEIYWDGRDDSRKRLKIGIYLLNLRAKSPQGKTTLKRTLAVIGTEF
ncbi:MAG: lamin tail domain-containing protein [candidate division WOR-3 bacterium]|nr:lamin tail domain-containing protein [candidate division WOR-3 bacterium]